MTPLRILLVDDHLLFRKGLARLLDSQPDFEVVGEAADGHEAVKQAEVLRPDLVLMDVRMPKCNGLEATRQLKESLPEAYVVMLTVSDDEQDLAEAVRCGADGYLLKDILPETLFQKVRGLAEGETPISRGMTGKLFHQLAQRKMPTVQPAAASMLSGRECEVLALVVVGCSNQEIAENLGIAHNTVKNHLRSILAKLGVKNRAAAAAYAVSQGLVCRVPEERREARERND